MIKKITSALLIVSLLSSCVGKKVICTQLDASRIKALPLCDISFQFNRCKCRCFDFNNWSEIDDRACKWRYGDFSSGEYPLEACEGIAGFFVDDIAVEVKPKVKKLAKLKADLCD